ncbi:MAG: hypothetical protein O7B81_04500 [Gammaproteobacteria bacterium]|nr:hypothetical protein [Gammaproteobacteria bacterium]
MVATPASIVFREFSIARSMARIAQQAARPAFELAFYVTQTAVLDKLDKDVAAILSSDDDTASQTAHLRIKVHRFNLELDRVSSYRTRVTSNRENLKTVQTLLTDLRALADSSTVADFDAKRTEVLLVLEKLRVAGPSFIGVSDKLRATKASAIAAIEGIVHNNFATQADIDTAQAAIDSVVVDLAAPAELIEINYEMAKRYDDALQVSIAKAELEIDDIKGDARHEKLVAMKEKQKYYANILTAISLAFEAGQAVTDFVAQNASFELKRPEPGSVLNLFT